MAAHADTPTPTLLRGRHLPERASARCTVGLLTWNAGDEIYETIRGLMAQSEAPLELVWIDNASTDRTVERVGRAFSSFAMPHVNAENRGFCGGHNQGLATCRTPYYLALNQDCVLGPDYIARLCDWLDAQPQLALVSGLILRPDEAAAKPGELRIPTIYSGGLVLPRVRFPFELGMDQPLRAGWERRRRVTGVSGAAMMLRVEACRAVSRPEDEVFPERFFAYGEEVDLALRLARAGYQCGVDGEVKAVHSGQSSGGLRHPRLQARFFANHWLMLARNESLRQWLRDMPYIVKGQWVYWLPRYLRQPGAFFRGCGIFLREVLAARKFYRQFEKKYGPTRQRNAKRLGQALEELRAARSIAQRETGDENY